MADQILESYFESFCDSQGLKFGNAENFEHFVNYCILSKYVPSIFDLGSLNVGKNGNYGIDGMAIIVNECIITSKKDIDSFIDRAGALKVELVFIQTKHSDSFDIGDFLKMTSAICDFCGKENRFITNPRLKDYFEIFQYIFKNLIKFTSRTCSAYYAYTGVKQDKKIDDVVSQQRSIIQSLDIFQSVDIEVSDSGALKKYYTQTENIIERTIDASYLTSLPLPKIEEVEEAFSGVISAKDLLAIITDEDSNMLRSLFSDNVRDFQGMNPVNSDIRSTLLNSSDRVLFPVLNNGITIVASDAQRARADVTLKNYQVVNGCQTCHVLYENREHIDGIFIPVKIISSKNNDAINKITKATNWQTKVNEEAFETTREFHKNLEQIFVIMQKKTGHSLYYERRSKQYWFNSKIKKYQIITMPVLLNCFMSMFLDMPHSTHQYYGTMLKEHRRNLFDDSHRLLPYYLSALLFNKVTSALYAKNMHPFHRDLKYIYLYCFKLLFWGGSPRAFNASNLDVHVESIINFLKDTARFEKCFDVITSEIDSASRSNDKGYTLARLKSFTNAMGARIIKSRGRLQQILPQLK